MIQIDSYRIIGPAEPSGIHNKYPSFKAEKIGNPPASGLFSLFPSGKIVTVKNSCPTDEPDVWRVEVKGVAAAEFSVNSVLIPPFYGAVEGKTALVVWKSVPPGNGDLDLGIKGLSGYAGGRVSSGKKARVSQITGKRPFLQIPGQIYQLSDRKRTTECVLLMAEPFTSEQVGQITKRVGKFGNFPGPDSIYSMNLRVRGFVCLPEQLADKEFEGAVRKGNWLIMDRLCGKWMSLIEKRAGSEPGIKEAELEKLLGCPEDLICELVSDRIAGGRITRSRGYLVNVTDTPERFLSPMTRSFHEELKQAGREGIHIKVAASRGRPDIPDILYRRGLARKLDHFVIAEEAYSSLAAQIMEIVPKGRPFDLSDLTGANLLSRSRLILVLDEMERDGLLKSSGENRRELA